MKTVKVSKQSSIPEDLPEFRDNPPVRKVYRNTNGITIYYVPEYLGNWVPSTSFYVIGWNGFKLHQVLNIYTSFREALFYAEKVDTEYLLASVGFASTPIHKQDVHEYYKIQELKRRLLRPFKRSSNGNNG